MADNHFIETKIPQQRNYNSIPFPSVISPNPAATTVPFSLSCFTETITTQKQFLESLLHRTGAVLFRGFGLKTAEDFNNVFEAFGYQEMPYTGGASRAKVFSRVSTANESPPDQKIPFHHEMSLLPEFPSKLFFFCEVEPARGGETPIVLSHIVYERVKQKYPEFVERLERYGLIYTKVLAEDDDPSLPVGRGWKSIFLTEEKSVAEQRAAERGMKLEWREDGGVKTITGPIPAFKYDKSRERKIWFNSISLLDSYRGWKDANNDPPETVTFGDGKPLPADIAYDCLKILEEECVAFPWQKGDVLLLDNWAVLHARRSCNPPRRILASLCK